MSNTQYYELYRRSSIGSRVQIGISLTDALDDLIRDGQIPPQLAMKILLNVSSLYSLFVAICALRRVVLRKQFDKSITDNLTEKVKSRMTFRVRAGHLDTYRFCDEVWTFIIKNPCFRLENDTMVVDRIKIVACNSKVIMQRIGFKPYFYKSFNRNFKFFTFFRGKTCLISGGSKGIGLGIAQRLAKEGNRCILVSRDEDRLKEALSTLCSPDIHEYYCLDVKDPNQWDQLSKKVDHLDVLVNAAGITQYSLLPKMSVEEITNIVSTNLLGSIYACRNFQQTGTGSIINISSSIILGGGTGATVYTASKAGISGFTKALSAEWASKGIRVNAISPGYVNTSMLNQMNENKRKTVESCNHIGRFGNIEEIASAAVFLISNNFITGTTLYVDGGI
ncbi:hypothetical protein PORY_002573 [Pneumocystis oryctolagi]|uniref:Uncharacterized protein n=1 Tax=Pneumocystis oryctolagi TaxID=42067 RepID=A0ACB7C9L1_9ASCO|nr:hypothetical protein PORY_002573 [Pneumocystis oryctolagi]